MSFLSLVRRPIPGIKGLIPVILELPRQLICTTEYTTKGVNYTPPIILCNCKYLKLYSIKFTLMAFSIFASELKVGLALFSLIHSFLTYRSILGTPPVTSSKYCCSTGESANLVMQSTDKHQWLLLLCPLLSKVQCSAVGAHCHLLSPSSTCHAPSQRIS